MTNRSSELALELQPPWAHTCAICDRQSPHPPSLPGFHRRHVHLSARNLPSCPEYETQLIIYSWRLVTRPPMKMQKA